MTVEFDQDCERSMERIVDAGDYGQRVVLHSKMARLKRTILIIWSSVVHKRELSPIDVYPVTSNDS